ncbi:unnamed protein product [Caenorhabditis angaria]|uniref:Serpentine receptor class gamma n=1 Tax=Caenorhabditis angaria TaxID=860376 RepID=A0A9P1NAV0_9PELO|nr:unnamed protein product [Caenorhabditis angaria]
MSLYLLWIVISTFISSQWNTIPITSTFHTIFVGAPIFGTIYMISINPAYLRRIKELSKFQFSSENRADRRMFKVSMITS